jgi:hypothetical protein
MDLGISKCSYLHITRVDCSSLAKFSTCTLAWGKYVTACESLFSGGVVDHLFLADE